MTHNAPHIPVMLEAVLDLVQPQANAWYIDATFGGGGYTQALLDRHAKVIAFDHDQTAIAQGQMRFQTQITDQSLVLIHENFAKLLPQITELRHRLAFIDIAGILFDFGTSTDQLFDSKRGFSFDRSAPLDMRMDQRLAVTAADLLHVLSEKELSRLFSEYGGEHEAKGIAKAIALQRGQGKTLQNTQDLAELVSKTKHERTSLHPATKVFQALRIAVNDELTNIELVLPQAYKLIKKPGGMIVTIAFHEGEDRIVKKFFSQLKHQPQIEILPLQKPSDTEIKQNPRSRSARLRALKTVGIKKNNRDSN